MTIVPMDAATVKLCDKHYPKCNTCPIQEPCHSGTGARLTVENLNGWRDRVNKAAAAAIGEQT